MNRSFRVRILGCDYDLRPGESDELHSRWGFMSIQKREIVYATHMDESTIKDTVFHELIHVADLATSTESNELTEQQVMRIGAVLFGILRDHDSLVEWLLGEE
ncbi:hypothetical protein LCGC14_0344660 [marine sediment metagenome]|uniref:Uncharacterized protein n=1 Tax=marine sediment metagenome TaxID=412755 RepID=A0A0F9TCM7_9ZZZZ